MAQAVQLAVTAAVAEAVAPPPPQDSERTRQLEDRVIALTAELKAANDRHTSNPCPSQIRLGQSWYFGSLAYSRVCIRSARITGCFPQRLD